MIVSVTLNPSLDYTLYLEKLKPHDTNRVKHTETDAGGKGINLSRIVTALGGETLALGLVGGGPGAFIKHRLDDEGVPHEFIHIHHDTRINVNIEDGTSEPPTTINAEGPEISGKRWNSLLELCRKRFAGAKWAAIGGSIPPGVPDNAFEILGNLAHECGCLVMLDADGDAMKAGLASKPDFIKPNDNEAARLLGFGRDTDDWPRRALDGLSGLVSEDAIVVLSRGSDGAWARYQGSVYSGTSPKIEAISSIGSGDSLLGAMLVSILRGDDFAEAFRWGLAAGAATACTDGSHIGSRAKIEELFAQASVSAN